MYIYTVYLFGISEAGTYKFVIGSDAEVELASWLRVMKSDSRLGLAAGISIMHEQIHTPPHFFWL